MYRLKYVSLLVAPILVLSALLSACAQSVPSPTSTSPSTSVAPTQAPRVSPTPTVAAPDTPRYGGVLRVGTPAGVTGLVPLQQSYDGRFMKAIYDTYVRVDEKGEFQPWLATDWKLSPDSKSLTLTLRKGVKFQDGTDFNAAAVKWNVEQRRDQ